MDNLTPGVPLTDKQKEALASENAQITAEAHRLAAEQRARDLSEDGNEPPLAQSIADSVRQKLEKEEFQNPNSQPQE